VSWPGTDLTQLAPANFRSERQLVSARRLQCSRK